MKSIDKRIAVLYVLVIFLIILSISYALKESSYAFNASTGEYGIDESAYGNTYFDASTIDLKPILDSEITTKTNNVIKIDFTVGGAQNNPDRKIIYDIALNDLDIDCDLLSSYVKWKLVKDGEELYSGDLSPDFDTIIGNRLVLTDTQLDLPTYSSSQKEYHDYSFYLWISDSCQSENLSGCTTSNDQSNLSGKSLSGKIEVELNTGKEKPTTRYKTGGDACSTKQKAIFDTKGGNINISSKEIVNGEEYGSLPIPTKDNYTFEGWYLDEEHTLEVKENSIVNSESNIILYANWIPIDYNITYNLNACTNNNNPSSYNMDTPSFTLRAPTCTGYTFNGWTGSNGNVPDKSVTIMKGSTGNKTYTTNITPNDYTITFNSNNLVYGLDDISSTTSEYMTYSINNEVVTVKANQDDGYGFTTGRVYLEADKTYYFSCSTNGTWGENNGTDTVQAFFMLNGEYTTYYQMWSNNNYEFTPSASGEYWLRLDVNKSGITHTFSNINIYTIVDKKTITYGNNIGTLPTEPNNTYPFEGWYEDKNGSGNKISENTPVPSKNTTYYASWKTGNKVKIQFKITDGSWAGSTNTSFAVDSESYITLDGDRNIQSIKYGKEMATSGLLDYNNSNYINIKKVGYVGVSGEEYKCISGCTTANKTFNQNTQYSSSDFCDASSADCTVVLTVNWTRNFTCAAKGSTTSYDGKNWYTVENDSEYCTLALNSLSSGSNTYANATTVLTSEYFTSGSNLLAEKDAGLLSLLGTYTGTTGISSGIFWASSTTANTVGQSFTYYTATSSSRAYYRGGNHGTDAPTTSTYSTQACKAETRTTCNSVDNSSCVISNTSCSTAGTGTYGSTTYNTLEVTDGFVKKYQLKVKAYNNSTRTMTAYKFYMRACGAGGNVGHNANRYRLIARSSSSTNCCEIRNYNSGNDGVVCSNQTNRYFKVAGYDASPASSSVTNGTQIVYTGARNGCIQMLKATVSGSTKYPIKYRLYIKVKK